MLELVSVTTQDDVELDGAHYRASERRQEHAVLIVHGLTWNFYRGPSRWLPPLLAEAGLDSLALNMRDHDRPEVMDFDLSHHDLRAGIDHLLAAGAAQVVVLAHGYGCNKLACYPKLSGDDRIAHFVFATLGAVKSYNPDIWSKVLDCASALRGRALIVQGADDKLIDARARADELSTAAADADTEVILLEGADHYFNHRHRELARCVVDWLA
ncbi:MAG TPA: hypothetical protein VE650_18865 [Acetobacteraceae bacterium]|nr:hypothetical protein [Acetobacteraceae bacterium]